jgi:hypothetical protein
MKQFGRSDADPKDMLLLEQQQRGLISAPLSRSSKKGFGVAGVEQAEPGTGTNQLQMETFANVCPIVLLGCARSRHRSRHCHRHCCRCRLARVAPFTYLI